MSATQKHTGVSGKGSSSRPSNQIRLPGTVGVIKPDRAIALLEKWRLEGDAKADREAYEAVREEIERARK